MKEGIPCCIAGELLGLDGYIPSFVTAKAKHVLKGVNYASAGSGIRQETGQQLVHFKAF